MIKRKGYSSGGEIQQGDAPGKADERTGPVVHKTIGEELGFFRWGQILNEAVCVDKSTGMRKLICGSYVNGSVFACEDRFIGFANAGKRQSKERYDRGCAKENEPSLFRNSAD